MIANYYSRTPKEKKIIINFCSQYPGIGLLNVAVKSMGCGLLDSIYDVIQLSGENNMSSSPLPYTTTEVMEIEPPSKENTKCIAKGATDSSEDNGTGHSVTIGDVISRITEYIESNSKVPEDGALWVRKLHDCETCITTQFSAKHFSALGHGTFLEFLEKHGHHFPPSLSSFLKRGSSDSSSLEVSVLQQQVEVLLCQAESNWLEDGDFSEDSFFMLLKRQFPTISFDFVQGKSGERLTGYIERQRKNKQTNSIKFSISLLEKRWSGISPGRHDNIDELGNGVVQQSHYSGTVCSREAINCLLKAPMLSDLLLWSHWDLLFAPSLGSFIHWLLNTGPVQELSCIVTTDGRFIKVDPSATIDQFLEAIIQRSSFQVAVILLSLLHIYDGSTNTPISLLKCYAQRAINIIIDNNDLMNANSESKIFIPEELHNLSAEQRDCSTRFIDRFQESSQVSFGRSIRSDSLSNIDGTVKLVAKFILDCLGHLPSEFRSLAADILLAGLRTVTKSCYSVMLHESTESWHLCMLHDIGLSLGVAEWVEDCRRLCLTEVHAKAEMHSSAKHTSEGARHENSNMLISNDVDTMDGRRKSFAGTNNHVVAIDNKDHKVLNPVGTRADITELHTNSSSVMGEMNLEQATLVIETIRREEFGLDEALSNTGNSLLKKQHARLGRALHCLSQELYSQDSHLLLELVQNADDNTYLEGVEPTLAFILQENGIVVLNNERGFAAENIRALCDIGNSTKKGSNRGYIGNKGIGFKSVFRVTDAPEIHSNGFHVKFDITEGQIGFVLPTAVPPYATSSFSSMLSFEDESLLNTCVVLPFRSKFREGTGMCSIVSMFSDLHPSLLLFLHRLKCIKFMNMLNDTLLVMRREALGDGIVRISHGNEIMSWLVVSKKLQGTIVRHDVCTTEIAVAFTLQETERGEYEPFLKQQPVFAFLPLRNYGLKFILQGDFVLPSSREEVDADSAWNQWLLSEFPSLFVSAQESLCALPCFQRYPGKAVTAFLSFIPLVGEVHGFFSQLPHLILSKLRQTRCLFLDGSSLQWVYPCNTLRGWDEQTKMLLSDGLLHEHLGLGYLSKDILISDKLSRALGIYDYGPNILMDTISSICRTDGCIESLGLEWLCAWFVTLYSTLLSHSFRNVSLTRSLEDDLLSTLRKIPCIPLSDGSFSSVADGPIWLPYDIVNSIPEHRSSIQNFQVLYSNLRTVSTHLLSASCKNKYLMEEVRTNDLIDILLKIGVRKLSGHDIIKNHIMASLCNGIDANVADKMMIEYVSFIMLHLQSSCTSCNFEKEDIVSELQKRPIFLTNHGYKCPADEPIHFSKDYGNSVDVGRLLQNLEINWIELDSRYLMNHGSDPLFELKKWRRFFEEIGVTDFVQVVKLEKNVPQVDSFLAGSHSQGDISATPCTVYDWESPELASILSVFSSKRCRENCIYLLEVLDKFWDDCYSAKARSLTSATHCGENRTVESSFLKCIRSFKWIASSIDEDLHYATDLFYDSENMRSLLGRVAPYAVPQVSSSSLRKDIGLKTEVSYCDALMVLKSWITSQVPFSASMNQMCKFYTFLSEGAADSKIDIKREFLSCSSIFTPLQRPRSCEVVPGNFFPPEDLYWHDPTRCSEMTEELISMKNGSMFPRRMLSTAYPSLCEFFTEACGVPKVPSTSNYVEILLRLSNVALPSQAANHVFRVFVRWANDLHSESDKMNDILYLKESLKKLETTILPTSVDKWVSLHPSFGLVCWVDDDELKQQFKTSSDVDFIQFGDLSPEDKQMLYGKVAALMKSLGIPALSKVVYREAIFYGTTDNREKAALIYWLLPYIQRYIYKMHRDAYMNFQQNEIMKLSNLQVIVVDKLFHKYVIRGLDSSSKKRFKCHCLLQGNTLYATQDSDSHSVFLELSRIFFDGSPDLHFANFLHMIKTMAESGTSAEQIESFIVNNQNVPELPAHEALWSFSSLSAANQGVDPEGVELVPAFEFNVPNHQRAPGIVSSWPPNNWKTAPDFRTSHRSHHSCRQEAKVNDAGPLSDLTMPAESGHVEDTLVPIDLEGNWIIEENIRTENAFHADISAAVLHEPQMVMPVEPSNAPAYLDLETGSSSGTVNVELTNFNEKVANVAEERERFCIGPTDASQLRTGRLGEALVHKYFAEQLGSNNVRWVNEESETGLPYDIVITRKKDSEYVEVKATVSSKKDWFYVTSREWQFALEKGDSFSIARVILSGTKQASIEMLKNPYKLYQQKALRLALLISR
ncbi:protein NO VEIN isoform X2 [Phragmites australis]|nr:protein NO VEIN isoform X2 [Phragmites australis]